MHTRLTAKLFHTVVVLGVGLTAGCSSSDTPETNNPTPATTSTTPASQTTTPGAIADAGSDAKATTSTSSSSSSSGDSFPGWLCCG